MPPHGQPHRRPRHPHPLKLEPPTIPRRQSKPNLQPTTKTAFRGKYDDRQNALTSKIVEARTLLKSVQIPYDFRVKISQICSELNVDGIRGDIVSGGKGAFLGPPESVASRWVGGGEGGRVGCWRGGGVEQASGAKRSVVRRGRDLSKPTDSRAQPHARVTRMATKKQVTNRAAKAIAAFEGRGEVAVEDIYR